MALSIIQAPRAVQSQFASLPITIDRSEEYEYDVYRGSVEEIIKAGIVRADQLPREGKNAVVYSRGQIITRKCKRDETYLRVQRWGDGTVMVWIGVPPAVALARKRAAKERRATHAAEAQLRALMHDPGPEVAAERLGESPARFQVGEACVLRDGSIAEITGDYRLRGVLCDDGHYLGDDGARFLYAFGYLVRRPGEMEYFARAGVLESLDGTLRHLKLVSNPS
jgi:hypothetical protein